MTNKMKKKILKIKFKTIVILLADFSDKKNDDKEIKILPPSRGYAGKRFISAIIIDIITNCCVKKYVEGNNHHTPKTKIEERIFAKGPAKAMESSSL